MFDADCDGRLSRFELVRAVSHLDAMRDQNCSPNPRVTSNGGVVGGQGHAEEEGVAGTGQRSTVAASEGAGQEAAGEEASPEDVADAAIKKYASEDVICVVAYWSST